MCTMKILKYNYSLLLPFKVKNKPVFVSFLYHAHARFGGNTQTDWMFQIQNTMLAYYGTDATDWSVLTDY